MLIFSLHPAMTSPVLAATREQLFYWGSVVWRGMGEITVKVHCFYSASSDVKSSSKYSFGPVSQLLSKYLALALTFCHPIFGYETKSHLAGWREAIREATSGLTHGPVLARVFWHVVESSNLPCTRSQNIYWHFGCICCGLHMLLLV